MFDLVIFDCDGVLVDSEPISIRVDAIVLNQIGWPLTEDEIVDRFVGRTSEYMIRDIERHIGRSLPDDFDIESSDLYRQEFEAHLKPVPGILEALDQIAIPTCVASSGTHEKMQFTLGLTGLYARFEGRIFSATEVAQGKPAPDLFLYAAERMGVPPNRCAVVEDSRFGVEAARAAGMHAFGFTGSVTGAAALEGPNTTVFGDMRELPGLLRASYLDT